MKNQVLLISSLLILTFPFLAFAKNLDYRNTTQLTPNDYLFGSHGKRESAFDEYRTIDLGVDLGISGADCGKIDLKNTLRAGLKNILDTKYLGSMGKDIIAASPMLLTCYFSPTWCSILKHSRIRANFLAQLRLNQCKAIDKYTDSKVNEFYEERAECVRKANQQTGGNFEKSMESCKNYWNSDIADWSGDGKTPENRLIESTAKWAGFKGKQAERVVSLTKAFIGDTVIKRGSISIDYGPRKVQITPRVHLMNLKNDTYSELCNGLVMKVINNGGYRSNIYRIVSNADLDYRRSSELFALKKENVLFKEGIIRICESWDWEEDEAKSTKAGYWRNAPIAKSLKPILAELLNRKDNPGEFLFPRFREWERGEQAAVLRSFCDLIGIPSVRFHTLRACFATHLLASGVDQATVMRIGGWKTFKTFEVYIRLAGVKEAGATDGMMDGLLGNTDEDVFEHASEILTDQAA